MKRLIAIASCLFASLASAQQPALQLVPVTPSLGQIVDIVHAGDGSGRLYLAQQSGRVFLLQDGLLRDTPFAELGGVVQSDTEQGLLSIAFAPQFPQSPHLFAWYTAPPDGATVLARFTVDTTAMSVDPQSVQTLLQLPQPIGDHNGGKLLFGPDGMLYLSTGDGGGSGDPFRNAQNLGDLHGKILRLDVATLPYAIPTDNPFAGQPGARPEIWSYGLRNPWRLSFDRVTGELWIADVGQASLEEVNLQPAGVGGQNWGWSCLEGSAEFAEGDSCRGAPPTPPVAEYGRADGCSISGGAVYRGSAASLQGSFIAGDFCSGKLFGVRPAAGGFELLELLDTEHRIVTVGEDEAGQLYLSDYSGGIHRIAVADESGAIDIRQIGSQYWLTGAGSVDGRVLNAELSSSTGTAFGDAFDPAAVVDRRWGSIEIEFTGCDSAILRWTSSGADSAGFGDGGYPLQRIAASSDSQRCNTIGFDATSDLDWITGSWYGGPTRDGEGLFLERLANGVVVVAFFTHRPAAAP